MVSSLVLTDRSRRVGVVAFVLAMVLLLVSVVFGVSVASADTTGISTSYKTGTDLTNGSTASSSAAPGGATTGTANPGDTIKWAVDYQNNTSGNASVDVKDPLTNAGTYVPGSLQLPPSADPTHPFSSQFSTDGGATWQLGTPPAGATGVGMVGTFPPQTQQQSVNPTAPMPVNLTNSAGDGYDAISSPDNSLVYAVFHHNNTSQNVFCATVSGALCPGWPVGSNTTATYVSPVSGTPIGTGANGMTTADENGTFIVDGRLYWEVQQTTTVAGVYPVGVMCLDLATLTSCGFTQLDTVISAPYAGPVGGIYGRIGGTGIPASNGNYYFSDASGNLLCFSPASGACGVTQLTPTTSTSGGGYAVTYGDYVFTAVAPATNSAYNVNCFNVVTNSACPGSPFGTVPVYDPFFPNRITPFVPVINATGNVTGICSFGTTNTTVSCWDLTGVAIANPYPTGAANTYGDVFVQGPRSYLAVNSGNSVGCFDFSLPLVGGKVQPCAGFTTVANSGLYAVRPMTGDSTCLLADGDGRKIVSFDALTGAACSSSTTVMTVSPAQYYCDSGAAGFQSWNQLAIVGAPAGSYTAATVSLTDSNGDPVAGFTNVTLTPGQSLNLMSIPKTAPTDSLSATVVFRSATSAITSAQVSISWVGNTPQMCFQTVVPPVACGQSAVVSNAAVAVTDATATGGGTDAPGGNPTGAAQFTVTPSAAQCSLEFHKTASPNPAVLGSSVMYTITVTNTGSMPYSSPAVAAFTDDLSNVLTDATYGGDAAASNGTVSYTSPTLTWTGPATFNPGDTAEITYSVTVNNPDSGPHLMRNTVVSDNPGSNCATGSTDAACTVDVPINSLALVKSADVQQVSSVGQKVTYSFLVTNTGNQTLTGVNVTDVQAAPAGGLDAAPVCLATTLAPNVSTMCTATYTVTQADLDNGSLNDTAVAHGKDPSDNPVDSPPSDVSIPVPPQPALTLVKSADVQQVSSVGQKVTYSFLVTNTGNLTLTGVNVTDVQAAPAGGLDAPPVCPVTTLAPGASTTCTATYTVTQADLDNGSVSDTAVAHGKDPSGGSVDSGPSAVVIAVVLGPSVHTGGVAAASGEADTRWLLLIVLGSLAIGSVLVARRVQRRRVK